MRILPIPNGEEIIAYRSKNKLMGGFETFVFVSKLNGTKLYMNINKLGISLYP